MRTFRDPALKAPFARFPDAGSRRALWLSVTALSTLAVAAPVLDLLGRNPEFFVVRRSQTIDVVALVAFLSLAPLAVLWTIATIARRSLGPKIELRVLEASLGPLASIAILAAFNSYLGTAATFIASLGLGLPLFYRRFEPLRIFLSYLAVASIAVPLLFFLRPGVRQAIGARDGSGTLSASGSTAPVFVLVFDEWSLQSILGDGNSDDQNKIDRDRLPNLASFAEHATWYRGARTVADVTELALPALLSGRLPDSTSLPTFGHYPDNLFTWLGGDHYVVAVEPITQLCPPALNRGGVTDGVRMSFAPRLDSLLRDVAIAWAHVVSPPPLRARLPDISSRWQGFTDGAESSAHRQGPDPLGVALAELHGGQRVEQFEDFLARIEVRERPGFYFNHLLLPHVPWEYLASGEAYLTTTNRVAGLQDEVWADDSFLVHQAQERYLHQVAFVDVLLGRFFDRLRAQGLYDRSAIVLVADHGVSFRPGKGRRLLSDRHLVFGGAEILADIVPIPLFIKAPGQRRGEIVDRPTTALQLRQLLAQALGVEQPFPSPSPADPQGLAFRGKYAGELTLTWQETRPAPLLSPPPLPTQLIGRIVPAERRTLHGTAPELVAQVEHESLFRNLDRRNRRLPALVAGSILDVRLGQTFIAVALNGVIAAVGRTWEDGSADTRFSVLLPAEQLRDGANDLELFLARKRDDDVADLLPIAVERRDGYRLRRDRSGVVVALLRDAELGDVRLPIEAVASPPGPLRGYLQAVQQRGHRVIVEGWAADMSQNGRVRELAAFAGDRYVGSGMTRLPRPDVAELLGDERFLHSGFRIEVAAGEVPNLHRDGVQVYVISSRGVASRVDIFYTRIRKANGPGQLPYVVVADGRRLPIESKTIGVIDLLKQQVVGPSLDGKEPMTQLQVAGHIERDGAAGETGEPFPTRLVFFEGGRYHSQFLPQAAEGEERVGFFGSLPWQLADAFVAGKVRLVAMFGEHAVLIEADEGALETIRRELADNR